MAKKPIVMRATLVCPGCRKQVPIEHILFFSDYTVEWMGKCPRCGEGITSQRQRMLSLAPHDDHEKAN